MPTTKTLQPISRPPKAGASIMALEGGPFDAKLGDWEYLCGHCGVPVLINQLANQTFAGPVEMLVRCFKCGKDNVGPIGDPNHK